MNREERRAAAKECRRDGHLTKTGYVYCVRCGLQIDFRTPMKGSS